jgi:hypothetical protein
MVPIICISWLQGLSYRQITLGTSFRQEVEKKGPSPKICSSSIYTQYPIRTKQKQVFRHFCKRNKNKKQIKVFRPCILFPLIILEMFLQHYWSTPVVYSIDWT